MVIEPEAKNVFSFTSTPQTNKKGSGLYKNVLPQTQLVYYDDPNELVTRLNLLTSSQSVDNTVVNNEIISILEELQPAVWWNAYCSSTELSKLASKILSLPATSAACERTFSTYKDVHSSKRNRLTNSRAGKLVYIKHNLKLKEETEKQINTPLAQQDYFENCESDCSAISVNLENEEEYNSDTDINSSEIDELMNMINS
ncbi:hypothetical protein QTP88_028834 [Uroleucon formosanum]